MSVTQEENMWPELNSAKYKHETDLKKKPKQLVSKSDAAGPEESPPSSDQSRRNRFQFFREEHY